MRVVKMGNSQMMEQSEHTLKKNFKCIYFERERERKHKWGRGREKERQFPMQVPHRQCRASCGAQTHEP